MKIQTDTQYKENSMFDEFKKVADKIKNGKDKKSAMIILEKNLMEKTNMQ